MKVVLFRHAQKGLNPFSDPELSEAGHSQAENLISLVDKSILPKPTHFWVSPKIRTAQTFQPLSQNLKTPLQVTDHLDLRLDSENRNAFRGRVQKFLNSFEIQSANKEVHFLCTHYDWIEESMTLINSDKDLNSFEFSHWSPTQFVVFELQDSLWKFLKKGSSSDAKSD